MPKREDKILPKISLISDLDKEYFKSYTFSGITT